MTPFNIAVVIVLAGIVGIAVGMLLSMPAQIKLSNENQRLTMKLEASNPIHTTHVVREPQFLIVTTQQHRDLVKQKMATQLLAPLVKTSEE